MQMMMVVRLVPTAEQREKLLDTMRQYNAAVNEVGRVAFENHTRDVVWLAQTMQRRLYEEFGLPAVLANYARTKALYLYGDTFPNPPPECGPTDVVLLARKGLSWRWPGEASLKTVRGRELVAAVVERYRRPSLSEM